MAVFTLIAILVSVVQAGYSNLVKKESIKQTKQFDTTPLDTSLNLEVLDRIQQTKEYSSRDILVVPTQPPQDLASQSATINE